MQPTSNEHRFVWWIRAHKQFTKQGQLISVQRTSQRQRPESPMLTLTWHKSNLCKVHKFHQKYILRNDDHISKSTRCLMFTETTRLLRDGKKGVWRWGKREIMYLSKHCHCQNDSCIKMGSNESHFNVLLIVRDKVTRWCPQTMTFLRRKESRGSIELGSFCLPA